MNEDDFYLKVARALTGCQLVEQQLKLYITEALTLVEKCVGNRMTFEMRGEDYEGSSLEKLISTFKKLNDNKCLLSKLNKFKDERNYLSHKGIARCLDPEGELSEPDVREFQVRLDSIEAEAQSLREAIHLESNKFTGHLYFDNSEPSK